MPTHIPHGSGGDLVISESFNLDNGAGTTIDRVVLRHRRAIALVGARIVYEDATTGTVAAGNMRLGSTVGGSEYAAATAYANATAVGTKTDIVLLAAALNIPANTPVIVRHTGVAVTQAGQAHLELEYMMND